MSIWCECCNGAHKRCHPNAALRFRNTWWQTNESSSITVLGLHVAGMFVSMPLACRVPCAVFDAHHVLHAHPWRVFPSFRKPCVVASWQRHCTGNRICCSGFHPNRLKWALPIMSTRMYCSGYTMYSSTRYLHILLNETASFSVSCHATRDLGSNLGWLARTVVMMFLGSWYVSSRKESHVLQFSWLAQRRRVLHIAIQRRSLPCEDRTLWQVIHGNARMG